MGAKIAILFFFKYKFHSESGIHCTRVRLSLKYDYNLMSMKATLMVTIETCLLIKENFIRRCFREDS